MSLWTVYEFLDENLRSTVRAWLEAERVPKEQVAALRAKLDLLSRGGRDLVPDLIHGPIKKQKGTKQKDIPPGLYKLKIRGNKGWKQLRPIVCYGPLPEDPPSVITVLLGAIEANWQLPPDCLKKAGKNKEILLNDPKRRRILRIPRDVA